ncbi:hypothetical protein DYB28_002883 [Aphanomyces astaci]|uniref:Sulfotransferase domain-containing protein n=1 Tax=Aphanomyces astaci TaxID=112090 RepID=A0A9X8E3A2_APHAT|nr:hypothetical protein DYB28_002883 [Aphanomyces astaci]
MVTVVDVGEIPLHAKHVPTNELPKDHAVGPLVTLRHANVNILELQERLRLLEQTMGIWDPANQVGNVPIRRAGHDVWGIDKIMLVFCDDYMKNVYEFPWLATWIDVLQPLFDLLNVPLNRVHNYWSHPRVHLIFDYVDAAYPLASTPRIHLTPDMVLHQTRRSVDVSTLHGSRVPPSFVVIGAQKAGTTSLYDYITQHDLAIPSIRKETHYLDWRWDPSLPPLDDPNGVAKHKAMYLRYFRTDILLPNPSIQSGEATPSYLLGGSIVIDRFKALMDDQCKILAILRNPVDRAFSHYNMTADTQGNPEQLRNRSVMHGFIIPTSTRCVIGGTRRWQIVTAEIAELEALGIHPDMSFDAFDDVFLKSRVNFTHGGHSFVGRGLYALQLAGWYQAFPSSRIHVVNMDDMKTPTGLQNVMDTVFSFLDLPPYAIQDTSAKNTRAYAAPLNADTRQRLEVFYAPFNAKLKTLLQGSSTTSFSWAV